MFVDFVEATIVYKSMSFAWDLGVQNIHLEGYFCYPLSEDGSLPAGTTDSFHM